MKTPVIASIILASAILSGPVLAQAGERHESYRNQESGHQYRDNDRREFRNREIRREMRHEFREREMRREFRHRDARRWARWHRRDHHRIERFRHDHHSYRPYRSAYVEHYYEPRAQVVVHTHDHGAPVVAGALIGGAVANTISRGDPGATFVGAMTGAMIAAH